MPVILDHVTQASEQDLIDLEKIYADYPAATRWADIQNKVANNSGIKLYAGRFNDRLLGAVTAKNENGKLVLNDFCVRAITRKRFVARDILRLVLEQESASTVELSICQESEGIDKLLSNAGFSRQARTYILNR